MKLFYITIFITTTLITTSSDSAQAIDEPKEIGIKAISSSANAIAKETTIEETGLRQPESLEELVAIAKARRFYNESLFSQIADESIAPETRLKHYSAQQTLTDNLASIEVYSDRNFNQKCIDKIKSEINADIEKHEFIIDEIKKIQKGEQDYEKIFPLYVILQYWVSYSNVRNQSAQNFSEDSFFKEMIRIIEKKNIPDQYRKIHCIFKFHKEFEGGHEKYITTPKIPDLYNPVIEKFNTLSERNIETITSYENYEKKFKKLYKIAIKKVALENNLKIVENSSSAFDEIVNYINNNENIPYDIAEKYNDIMRRYSPSDYGNIKHLFLFIEQLAPVLYDSSRELANILRTLDHMLHYVNFQIEMKKKFFSEMEEQRAQIMQEKWQSFQEDRNRLEREYEERSEKRRIEAEQQAEDEAKKIALEMQTSQKTSRDLELSDREQNSALPKREKTKRRGYSEALDTAKIAATEEENEATLSPDTPIIPEDIKALVEKAKSMTFKNVKKLFRKKLNAKITPTDDGFKFEFRSPVTDEYTIFYAHNPHGPQLNKEHPGWWHNMVDAFYRADMAIR